MDDPGLFDDVSTPPADGPSALDATDADRTGASERDPSERDPSVDALGDGAAWPGLNAAQREAVEASLAPQLVVAGPGTGKTRVLVCRAAYLLTAHGDRFQPSDVAVITFTRKAARQLTARLADIVGPPAQHVRAGTIHQFCHRILTDFGTHPDAPDDLVPDDVVVASEAVTDAFWQRWFEDNERWCKSRDIKKFRYLKTDVSRMRLGLSSVPGRLQSGIRDYEAMLDRRGAVDFDDLLTRARDLVEHHPTVRDAIRAQTRALLVDEFQDTDPVQYRIMKRLGRRRATPGPDAPDATHLFMVADDDQSIYRFRGAEPKNLQRFIDDFGCTRASDQYHVLTDNYRSNRAIYSVAETVLSERGRLKNRGEIVTVDESRDPVVLTACADEATEIEYVLEQVQDWVEAGVPRSEIAVLARWRSTVQTLEQTFLRAGVACEASTADPIMQVQAVRQLLATLSFVECIFQKKNYDGPLDDVLRAVFPDDLYARIRDFWSRKNRAADGDVSLWGTFQRLARDSSAAQAAGLEAEWHRLERVYAALGNVTQYARQDDATVGSLAAETMRQLGGSTQLLSDVADRLADSQALDGVAAAASALRTWRQARFGGAPSAAKGSATKEPAAKEPAENGPAKDGPAEDGPRVLVYDRRPRRMQLWRAQIRHALDCTDAPDHVPTRSPVAFVAQPEQDAQRTLGAGDLVVTADLEGFVRWAGSNGVLPDADDGPRVLLLGPRTTPDETLALNGVPPDRVTAVAPDASASPSVRLFRLLQATVAPPAPEPLFDDYVMVDLETTSLDVDHCRVAEIGALRVRGGEVVDRFETLIQLPGDLTDEERETLRTVCGLDPETDFGDAVPLAAAWRAFCDFTAGLPLVAHNGRGFDFRVLKRLRQTHAESGTARWSTTYDTLPAAIELCPELPRHSAEALREALLDDATPTAHRALADCRDQQRILEALQARRAVRQRVTALEPLLPLVLAGAYDEVTSGGAGMPDDPAWTEDDRRLLDVGYRWALRDASPASALLGRVLPRALPELVRASPVLYAVVDEEGLVERDDDRQPGLTGRIEALLAPYRDAPVRTDLGDVLSHLALWRGDDVERSGDVVTLSTYHSAKGLEFERVLCTGVQDGIFPAFYDNDREARQESQRLLYVGMTRAERHLVVTHAEQDRFDRSRRRSPFLSHPPDDLVVERRVP